MTGHALREILTETGTVQGIDEELVPIRRAAVDDRERRHRGIRRVGRELQARDVPVEPVVAIAQLVPLGPIAEAGRPSRVALGSNAPPGAASAMAFTVRPPSGNSQPNSSNVGLWQRGIRTIVRQQFQHGWTRRESDRERESGTQACHDSEGLLRCQEVARSNAAATA